MKRLFFLSSLALSFGYQSISAAADSTLTAEGCVMPLDVNPEFFTLCEPNACSLLTGKVNKDWTGHTVKLKAILHPPTSTQPRTLEVTEALTVGQSCNNTCKPTIPGRGLGPKDKPQGQGGTPGAVSPPPTPK
jgi:hypothetical protein